MATTTQKRTIYNGDLSLVFNPKARNRYLVTDGLDSTSPVGVTTVLSKVLAKEALMLWPMYEALNYLKNDPNRDESDRELGLWTIREKDFEEAAKAHTRKSDKGKDIGSEVHEAIEAFLAGEKQAVSKDAQKSLQAFKDWYTETKPKVLATEQIVYSRNHNVAGTFDALLQIDGKTVLADIKTSNLSRTAPRGCYPEYLVQLGAYAGILAEMEPETKIDDLLVINATKDGKLFTTYASDLGLSVKDCVNTFRAVLYCYRFLEPLKRKIQEQV